MLPSSYGSMSKLILLNVHAIQILVKDEMEDFVELFYGFCMVISCNNQTVVKQLIDCVW